MDPGPQGAQGILSAPRAGVQSPKPGGTRGESCTSSP